MQEVLDDIFLEKDRLYYKQNRLLIGGMLLQLAVALAAIVFAVDDIESIIKTGPTGCVVGLLVFGFSYKWDFPERKKIGLSAPMLSLLCFCLIYFLDWSPREAHVPITLLILFYAIGLLAMIVLEIKAYRKEKKGL